MYEPLRTDKFLFPILNRLERNAGDKQERNRLEESCTDEDGDLRQKLIFLSEGLHWITCILVPKIYYQ